MPDILRIVLVDRGRVQLRGRHVDFVRDYIPGAYSHSILSEVYLVLSKTVCRCYLNWSTFLSKFFNVFSYFPVGLPHLSSSCWCGAVFVVIYLFDLSGRCQLRLVISLRPVLYILPVLGSRLIVRVCLLLALCVQGFG